MMVRFSGRAALATLVIAGATSGAAVAAESPFNGTWHLDLAQSSFPQGKPPVTEIALFQNTAHEEFLRATVEMEAGKPSESDYVALYGDRIFPVHNFTKGTPAGGAKVHFIDAHHEEKWGYDNNGKLKSRIEREISADGKTLTSAIYGVDGKLMSRRVFVKD